MLASTDEIARHLEDPSWVLFDCRHDLTDHARGRRLYLEGHLPGAHFAAVETDLSGSKTGRNGRHPLPAPQVFADFLGRHGVVADSTVVAYDDVGGLYAARLWWMTRWVGLAGGVLLDGGFPKWVAEGRPVSTEVPAPRPSQVTAGPGKGTVLSSGDVMRRLGQTDSVLVDARTPERYRGETEPIDPVAGRIPGAVNRPYRQNLNSDLTFRAPAELRRELGELTRRRPPADVVHFCGSGVTACANLFAMEYAGLSGSKVYAGSWSEWISDPARPVERGAT
ncbi:MAG: 3-mercaptopyruvate sulfurtransferase [Verrucomicrobia bacterium]|nr:3-mercaptopyruvate sulfurtransferase [Verrucomicrobiota bacterium]